MPFEVDYIPVGEGERSGDAICLRYGNLLGPRNEQTVIIIDGGDKEAGDLLVKHIKDFYKTDYIDYVISTHPDGDHSSGLCTVLEELKIGTLLMHKPWEYASDVKDSLADGRWTARGISEKIEKSLRHASELESLAKKKGVTIVEPFQGIGTKDGSIHILGPSQDFYQEMVGCFRCVPEPKIGLQGLIGVSIQKVEQLIKTVEDRFDIDLLDDDEDATSAENNTSVITLITLGDNKLLFTGDAGKTSLLGAIAYADTLGISLTNLNLFHVPHHGSRRNLSSKILKKISGITAFISATGENEKHPSKRVTNALKKHGANDVIVLRKRSVLHHHEANHRGWTQPIPGEQFHLQVEE